MIKEGSAYAFCKDDICLIENYDKAINDLSQTWECHHKLGVEYSREYLKNHNLYYHQPAEDLIFLTSHEHRTLHNKGKKLSQETKDKISVSLTGKKQSEETINKRREKLKGHPNWGTKHQSEESRRKTSIGVKNNLPKTAFKKGQKPWNTGTHGLVKAWNRRRVLQYTKDMVFVAEFESVMEATEKTGVSNIAAAARGKLKNAGGYVWKYK